MRFIVVWGMLWVLVGCTGGAFTKTMNLCPEPQEQQLFIAALDQFTATSQLDALVKFQKAYPASVWADHAGNLVRHARSERQNLDRVQVISRQLETELSVQKSENQQLTEKIEQLKKLLIELEQRPR